MGVEGEGGGWGVGGVLTRREEGADVIHDWRTKWQSPCAARRQDRGCAVQAIVLSITRSGELLWSSWACSWGAPVELTAKRG